MKTQFTVTVPAVMGESEARGAAALVGPLCVLTLVSTEPSRIMPALINVWGRRRAGCEWLKVCNDFGSKLNQNDKDGTFTLFGDAVEDVANPALAAVRPHEVHTAMVTTHITCATLIDIYRRREGNSSLYV